MDLPLDNSDENYTFITTDLLDETTDTFQAWIDKNGVQCVITNEFLGSTIHNAADTLPIQSEIEITPPTATEVVLHDEPSCSETVTKMTKTVVSKEKRSKSSNIVKGMLDKFANDDNVKLYVELRFVESPEHRVEISLSDEIGSVVTYYQLASTEIGGEMALPDGKQEVSSVTRIPLAANLDVQMTCLQTVSGSRLFLCPVRDCHEAFTRQPAARRHALAQLGHKEHRCEHPGCTWAFYSALKLKRHRETHLNRKDFRCDHGRCTKRFTTIYNLNVHRRSHERVAHLNCSVPGCEEKFQTARGRERHVKTQHDRSEAPFKCPQDDCPRTFFLSSGLAAHLRTHLAHRDSELRCTWPDCGREFKQPSRLKEHSRRHTGQRPYRCTHTGCTWTFTTASKLKRHQSTHTNDRKFHCTIGTCAKSFLRSEHLREHTLTHVGQRSFQCEVCSSSFFGKSSLCLHMKKVHPGCRSSPCARVVPYPSTSDDSTMLLVVTTTSTNPTNSTTDTLTTTPATTTLTSGSSSNNSSDNSPSKLNAERLLLEQAIQSLGVPSDMMLGAGLLPETPLELLGDSEHFSTVNLRDLE